MAIDVVESPTEQESQRFSKVWKELCDWKFFKSIKTNRLRGSWKFVVFILLGALLAYLVGEKIGNTSPEVNVFVSRSAMEALLKVEQQFVEALNSYADELQHKVDVIRSGLAQMRKPSEIHNINVEEFLSNPLNSFPMLRRLKMEWKAWEKYLNKHVGKDQIRSIHSLLNDVPNFDLLDTLDCFEVLREIYDIQPSDWIQGKLQDKKYDKKFSSLDAYSMAFLLTKRMDYKAANDWFLAALNSYEDCDMYSFMNFNRSLIHRSFADNLLKQNLTEEATMGVGNEFLENDAAENEKNSIETMQTNISEPIATAAKSGLSNAVQRCCRGELEVDNSSQLHCYYNSSINDFVRLAPFKVEELHLDPIVLLYHDIINDGEISELKDISKDRLKLSETVDGPSRNRTSENTWIERDDNRNTGILNQRIADMTGLFAEGDSLLVGKYAPGGLYRVHLDCVFSCEEDTCDGRFMTVLLYLSDVESGGATIFPELKLSVFPQKGKALIWYNLHNDMRNCDARTMHMGCPVVVGTKWFAVQWIYYQPQIFKKPCVKNTTNVHSKLLNAEQVLAISEKESKDGL